MSQAATTNSTQYASKRRKRPQPRNKTSSESVQVKSNPSKRHRDRLNTELERLSQLLPLSSDVVNKLDKLSILRLAVAYLRNKSYAKYAISEAANEANNSPVSVSQQQNKSTLNDVAESDLALQALEGFIIVVTQDFNVFYITSNVQDCLGFPQSDVIYLSMLDLIHAEDRKLFTKQMHLNPYNPCTDAPTEEVDVTEVPEYVKHGLTPEVIKDMSQDGLLHRSFICRLRCLHDTSSGFLALHFTGHLGLIPGQNRHNENGTPLPPEMGLFLLASPLQTPSILEIRTKNYIFRTKHKLDYTPLGVDQKGRIVLGYTEHELRQQSGYQFIHSADMMHCADAHTKLMRKGQSGMTVFRLLHRANRWQWVTASARLIFNKGQPDYIISTHRPITDQEGEEHLKKRSNAFRFDFTGHASLYASVNPIGAGPPPQSNNKSYGGATEPKSHMTSNGPSHKRPRISNNLEYDPGTLYGAQSLQSMDNYKEGLPIIEEIKTSNSPPGLGYPELGPGVKSEQVADIGVPDMSSYFTQNMPPLPMKNSPHSSGSISSLSPLNQLFNDKGRLSDSDHGDSGYSDHENHLSPPYYPVLDPVGENEPPPLHHPPMPPSNQSASYSDPYNSHPMNGNYQPQLQQQQNLNRYNHVTQPSNMPTNQVLGRSMNHQQAGHNTYPRNHQQPIMNGHYHAPTKTAPGHQILPHNPMNNQGYGQNYSQGYQPAPGANNPAGSNMYHNSIGVNPYMNGRQTTSRSKEGASVLNALEISSVTTTQRFTAQDESPAELANILGSCANFLEADKKAGGDTEITLQCQEHTLQFDLDKIAAEYQTVNPYSVVQNFVQNNPTEAMTIAKGVMPEVRVPANGMIAPHQAMNGMTEQNQDQYRSCQYNNGPMTNLAMNMNHMAPQMHPPAPTKSVNVKTEELLGHDLDFSLDDFIDFTSQGT